MRIEVSGKQFVFPRSCACCGRFPTQTIEVRGGEKNQLARTKGWVWDVPYCLQCKKHVVLTDRVQIGALALVAFAIGVAFTSGFARGPLPGLAVAALGVTGVGLVFVIVNRLRRQHLQRNCWGLGLAVEYLGSNRDCHAFEIKSYYYARDFILANHRKIVNASAKVAGILRNTEFGDYQVPRRLLRRVRR
jgi:hypothetical protein